MKKHNGSIQAIGVLILALLAAVASAGLLNQARGEWKDKAEKAEAALAALARTHETTATSLAACNSEKASFRGLLAEQREQYLRAEAEGAKLRAAAERYRKDTKDLNAYLAAQMAAARPLKEQCDAAMAVVTEYRRVHEQR